MAKVKTPEERSEILDRANAKAKRGYKGDLKKRTKVSPAELEVMTDMLISLKLVGFSNSQCGAIVGLSRGQVKEITTDEKFQKRLMTLKTKLPEAAINLGRAYLVEAVQWVVHVGRTEKDNALVLKAAETLFDRFGIPKTSRNESKVENSGEPAVGTEIPKGVMDKLRTASPEVQAAIADLNDSFLEGVERILNGGSDGSTE